MIFHSAWRCLSCTSRIWTLIQHTRYKSPTSHHQAEPERILATLNDGRYMHNRVHIYGTNATFPKHFDIIEILKFSIKIKGYLDTQEAFKYIDVEKFCVIRDSMMGTIGDPELSSENNACMPQDVSAYVANAPVKSIHYQDASETMFNTINDSNGAGVYRAPFCLLYSTIEKKETFVSRTKQCNVLNREGIVIIFLSVFNTFIFLTANQKKEICLLHS